MRLTWFAVSEVRIPLSALLVTYDTLMRCLTRVTTRVINGQSI